jgi:hypothetical protein
LFAAAAAGEGIAACSNSTATTPPGDDSGVTPETGPAPDTGVNTSECSGPAPVMTVLDNSGNPVAPDWSCYQAGDGGFLDLDAGDDAAETGDDGGAVDSGDDGSVPPDANTPDTSAPPDASSPDAGSDASANGGNLLHVVDFSNGQAPAGASVDVVWGPLTAGTVAFTGTVDSNGLVAYPAAPAGVRVFSYHLYGGPSSNLQQPVYWDSMPIVTAGNGQAEGNSVAKSTYTVLVGSVLGSEQPNPNLSSIVAGGRDCAGHEVQGMQFQIVDGDTGQPIPTGNSVGSTRALYLKNNLPNVGCTYTTNSPRAVWAMINAPVNLGTGVTPHNYVIQTLGRMKDSDTSPVVFDQHPVESYPGGVSVLRSGRYNLSTFH